ncbi:MAG TPA: segregation and condensation protein A [Gammaproteobacteria bacterium]|nr:segregation and condensation protein A [Gammaproteobacteria bacterium]
MSEETQTKEELILSLVKRTLTDVIKDTATKPGLRHPLNDETIKQLRDCLGMITQREHELAQEAGRDQNMRPRFIDETPASSSSVVVSLDALKTDKKKD